MEIAEECWRNSEKEGDGERTQEMGEVGHSEEFKSYEKEWGEEREKKKKGWKILKNVGEILKKEMERKSNKCRRMETWEERWRTCEKEGDGEKKN